MQSHNPVLNRDLISLQVFQILHFYKGNGYIFIEGSWQKSKISHHSTNILLKILDLLVYY